MGALKRRAAGNTSRLRDEPEEEVALLWIILARVEPLALVRAVLLYRQAESGFPRCALTCERRWLVVSETSQSVLAARWWRGLTEPLAVFK